MDEEKPSPEALGHLALIRAETGFELGLLAWPGIAATVRIVRGWTARRTELLESEPALSATLEGLAARDRRARDDRRADPDQWRSMLFFRAVPGLFAVVWTVLTVVALVVRR